MQDESGDGLEDVVLCCDAKDLCDFPPARPFRFAMNQDYVIQILLSSGNFWAAASKVRVCCLQRLHFFSSPNLLAVTTSSTRTTIARMPPKSSSLASLLGTLTNAAPVDFDPEALDADQPGPSTTADDSDAGSESHQDDDDDEHEEDEEYMNPRAHYADVGTSDMRKRAALSESDKIKDARYQGVKSSRAELYGDDDEEEEDEEMTSQTTLRRTRTRTRTRTRMTKRKRLNPTPALHPLQPRSSCGSLKTTTTKPPPPPPTNPPHPHPPASPRK